MLNPNICYVTYDDLFSAIRSHLSNVPRDIEVIVGIPRSGMITAYALSLYLNLPVVDLSSFLENRWVGHGMTRKVNHRVEQPLSAKKIMLVDDSYCSGRSLNEALEKVHQIYKGDVVTCAAIVTPEAISKVDLSFMKAGIPRVFEWNVFHHSIMSSTCLDFDGVLCVDPTNEENDDGEKYRRFLRTAAPLFIPTVELGYIVSSRLEKYREETECWLQAYGIKYKGLYLLNLPSKEERIQTQAHHKHKIDAYLKTGASLFVESNLEQAQLIATATGKPVLCTETMQMVSGTGLHAKAAMLSLIHQRNRVNHRLRAGLLSCFSPQTKQKIKRLLGRA